MIATAWKVGASRQVPVGGLDLTQARSWAHAISPPQMIAIFTCGSHPPAL